jgi:hypothetical protein
MQVEINSEMIVTICLFLAGQTGALIFFCGVVVTSLREHDRRIGYVEKKCEELGPTVIRLSAKEEIA